MIKLFILIAVLIAGVIVGPMLAGHQGYVLISAANQTLEMSVTTFIVLLVVILGLFFLLENILKRLFSMSARTSGWWSRRKINKARQCTNDGLLKIIEGDWKSAEKLALKGLKNSDNPVLNYLTAATAAQELKHPDQRDEYLKQASELDEKSLAIALTRAKLQVSQGQYEQALASLQGLRHDNDRNTILLNLLKTCYLELEDWKPLLSLLPSLEKQGLIDTQTNQNLTAKAECGLMNHITEQEGSEGLLRHWNDLSRKQRQDTKLIVCFVQNMLMQQSDANAFTVLKEALKKNDNPELIALLGQLKLDDTHPIITTLESLIKAHPDNVTAVRTLADIYIQQAQWENAKTQLVNVIKLQPTPHDYGHLVAVLDALNEPEEATRYSREALALTQPQSSAIAAEQAE